MFDYRPFQHLKVADWLLQIFRLPWLLREDRQREKYGDYQWQTGFLTHRAMLERNTGGGWSQGVHGVMGFGEF